MENGKFTVTLPNHLKPMLEEMASALIPSDFIKLISKQDQLDLVAANLIDRGAKITKAGIAGGYAKRGRSIKKKKAAAAPAESAAPAVTVPAISTALDVPAAPADPAVYTAPAETAGKKPDQPLKVTTYPRKDSETLLTYYRRVIPMYLKTYGDTTVTDMVEAISGSRKGVDLTQAYAAVKELKLKKKIVELTVTGTRGAKIYLK
jgi:hypothetical protein